MLHKVTSIELIFKQKPKEDVELNRKISIKEDEGDKNNDPEEPKLKKTVSQVIRNKRDQAVKYEKVYCSSKKHSFSKGSWFARYLVSKDSTTMLFLLRKFKNCEHRFSCPEHMFRNTVNTIMLYTICRPWLFQFYEYLGYEIEDLGWGWKTLLAVEAGI